MIATESILKDLASVVLALLLVLWFYFQWKYQYWARKGIPYLKPTFPFGNMQNPFSGKKTVGVVLMDRYNEMRRNKWRHGGLFTFVAPNYFIVDPEYIRNILTKDFAYFVDRGFYDNEKDDPLSAHLFALGGTRWKNLRAKLTPTFTSGKMRMMFSTVVECDKSLLKKIKEESDKKEPIDIKEVLACFTTDVIGSCAFGLDCDSFSDSDSLFRKHGKKFLEVTPLELLKRVFAFNYNDLARTLHITMTPKDTGDFFLKLVKDTVNYREKNEVSRKDFMQLLIDLKNNKLSEEDGYKHDGNTLTLNEIAAQSVLFFVAGFETSSTTMTFALYELSRNQHIQNKVRQEIKSVLAKYDNQITYEGIQEMKYLEQVVNETLRKYPPLPFINRKCIKDYKIPDKDVIIEKGTTVILSILGVHYDEDYYPNPEKFDPDRFTEENKTKRPNHTFLPFGEGPRLCIGLRFGMMQSKIGLAALLKSYQFTVNKKTLEPLQFKKESIILSAVGEIWLDAKKI